MNWISNLPYKQEVAGSSPALPTKNLPKTLCRHCGVSIGYLADPWGGKHGTWKHRLDEGPDAYVYCGYDSGNVAEPFPSPDSPYSGTFIDGLVEAVTRCQHEAPESSSGACDGGQLCGKDAVVIDLTDELHKCAFHAVIAERAL